MDFFMPIMTGMEAARVLTRLVPAIPILIVTFDITTQLLEQARSAAIKGAAQKSNTHELVNGVEALLRNETFFYERTPTQPV
jgi:DNA-binding NarL/FixJ family response regulator